MPRTTPSEMLERAGRALNPGDDWQARLANELDIRRDTVRQWCSGHLRLRPDHFETLLVLLVKRRDELTQAEADLRAWLDHNRDNPRKE